MSLTFLFEERTPTIGVRFSPSNIWVPACAGMTLIFWGERSFSACAGMIIFYLRRDRGPFLTPSAHRTGCAERPNGAPRLRPPPPLAPDWICRCCSAGEEIQAQEPSRQASRFKPLGPRLIPGAGGEE